VQAAKHLTRSSWGEPQRITLWVILPPIAVLQGENRLSHFRTWELSNSERS